MMLPTHALVTLIENNVAVCVSSLVVSSASVESRASVICRTLIGSFVTHIGDGVKFHCVGSSVKHTQVCTSLPDFAYVAVHLRENHTTTLPSQLLDTLYERLTAALSHLRRSLPPALPPAIIHLKSGNKTLQLTYCDSYTNFSVDIVPAIIRPGVTSSEGCYVPRSPNEWLYQWKGLEPFLLERCNGVQAVALAKVVKDTYFPNEKIKSCAIEFLLASLIHPSNSIEELRPLRSSEGGLAVCTFVNLYRLLLGLKLAVSRTGNLTITQLHDHESNLLADLSDDNRSCVDRALTGVLVLIQEFVDDNSLVGNDRALYWILTNQQQLNSWNGAQWLGRDAQRLRKLLKPKLCWSEKSRSLVFAE